MIEQNSGVGMRLARVILALALSAALTGAAVVQTRAAGAFAIGKCAAYGYAFDFKQAELALARARQRCAGPCEVVQMRKSCAAFAVDMANPCGAHGYAVDRRISAAQNTALRYCYRYGGKECVIRAWACDVRG